MGMQGPLTAQALGRSPYDAEPADGEGDETFGSSSQQYDSRGRPLNPETKRINRNIIRAHNEVMLAVGVAEAENPTSAADYESNRQHDAYESNIGIRLIWASKRCIEMVGVFGVNGLRQRILIYKEFARTPCWSLFHSKLHSFSVEKDVLAGAPSSLLANYISRRFLPAFHIRVLMGQENDLIHQCAYATWNYFKIHLELYAAFQRLGLTSSAYLLPPPKFFVPFAEGGLISKPPPIRDFKPQSLLLWLGGACASAAPFLIWAMIQQLMRGWRADLWSRILMILPNPIYRGRPLNLPPEPPEAPEEVEIASPVIGTQHSADNPTQTRPSSSSPETQPQSTEESGSAAPPSTPEVEEIPPPQQPELNRRQSTQSVVGADDFGSDEEDNDFLNSNVFRFEVEATEAIGPEPPSGLWSAELRPSADAGESPGGAAHATYLSTMLTRLPSVTAAAMFADCSVRLISAPYEAMALRLAAHAFCYQNGLPTDSILSLSMLQGLNLTWLANFFTTEFSYLVLSGEIWSATTAISSWLHKSEEEWKEFDGKDWGDWLGIFRSNEPLY